MFEDNNYYYVSTKYLYYILGGNDYNDEVKKILDFFISCIQEYRDYMDSEFDYYLMNGKDLNYLINYHSLDELEVVNDNKKLIKEVVR